MQEDIEVLESALRDIAHAVIQDAESRDTDAKQTSPHIHLSPGGLIQQRSPKRSTRNNTIPAFAESTISAVRAALQKYQLTIRELQVHVYAISYKKIEEDAIFYSHFMSCLYKFSILDKITNEQGANSNDAQAVRHRGGKCSDIKYKSCGIDLSVGYMSFAMRAIRSREGHAAEKSQHCKIGEECIG